MCVCVCVRYFRVGLAVKRRDEWRTEGLREESLSLGAGRPMWLSLALFVFPTQSASSGAIPTHHIHMQTSSAHDSCWRASCLLVEPPAAHDTSVQPVIRAAPNTWLAQTYRTSKPSCWYLTFLGQDVKFFMMCFCILQSDMLSIILPIMHVNVYCTCSAGGTVGIIR